MNVTCGLTTLSIAFSLSMSIQFGKKITEFKFVYKKNIASNRFISKTIGMFRFYKHIQFYKEERANTKRRVYNLICPWCQASIVSSGGIWSKSRSQIACQIRSILRLRFWGWRSSWRPEFSRIFFFNRGFVTLRDLFEYELYSHDFLSVLRKVEKPSPEVTISGPDSCPSRPKPTQVVICDFHWFCKILLRFSISLSSLVNFRQVSCWLG